MHATADIPAAELARRVAYALLGPAVRLAFAHGVPVREVEDLVQMAYFHEVRRSGRTLQETADALGVSLRKAAQLSARLKQGFTDAEREEALPRRVEFVLWAGPLSEARIRQALPGDEPAEVSAALRALVAQGRVRALEGRTPTYEVVRGEARLVSDRWLARIDGLNTMLGSVGNAVFARFFRPEAPALARTLAFRVRRDALGAIAKLYEETIFPALRALEEDAKDDAGAATVEASFLFAPKELIERELARAAGREETS